MPTCLNCLVCEKANIYDTRRLTLFAAEHRFLSIRMDYFEDSQKPCKPKGFEPCTTKQVYFGEAEGWTQEMHIVPELSSSFHRYVVNASTHCVLILNLPLARSSKSRICKNCQSFGLRIWRGYRDQALCLMS